MKLLRELKNLLEVISILVFKRDIFAPSPTVSQLLKWDLATSWQTWWPTGPPSGYPRVFPKKLARKVAKGLEESFVECQVVYRGESGSLIVGPRFLVRSGDSKGMREAVKWSILESSLFTIAVKDKADIHRLTKLLAPIFADKIAKS